MKNKIKAWAIYDGENIDTWYESLLTFKAVFPSKIAAIIYARNSDIFEKQVVPVEIKILKNGKEK